MKVTTEELERCQVLVTVEIDPKKEKDILQKAAKRIAKEIKIPGFRPGKAPYNVVIRRFGLEAVQQEALEKSADTMIQKALEEADVKPFARMDLESIDWDPLVIKVKVPTEPKVELSDFRQIRLDFEEIEVTDEDVGERLNQLQEQSATWTPVERPAELDDQLTISVVEKNGDVVLSEQESIEYQLVPVEADETDETDKIEENEEAKDIEKEETNTQEKAVEAKEDEIDTETEEAPEETYKPPFHPDLTTPLLGLKADEETTFSITYPEDYGDEDYNGQEITFEVKVIDVKAKELSEIDDDFAKTVSDFDTLDELKVDIREQIEKQRLQAQNSELGNEALEKIAEESDIEWPQAYEDESVDRELENYERQVSQYGLSLDSYLNMENKTREDFIEESRERIVNRLKRSFILRKIADMEKLKVGESEILQHAKFLSDLSGQGDRLWRDILSSPIQQELIANDLLVGKVVDWLAAIARGEDPQVEAEPTSDDQTVEDATDTDASPAEVEIKTDEAVEAESSEATASDEEVEPERENITTETTNKEEDVDHTEEPTPAGIKN